MAIKTKAKINLAEIKEIELTSMKAIRLKSLDCRNFSFIEVENCVCNDCSFFPYRFGETGKKKISDEQKSVIRYVEKMYSDKR